MAPVEARHVWTVESLAQSVRSEPTRKKPGSGRSSPFKHRSTKDGGHRKYSRNCLFIGVGVGPSTYVSVKKSAGGGKKRVRHPGENALDEARAPSRIQMERLPGGKRIIVERPA